MTQTPSPIHESVREHYAESARNTESCCEPGSSSDCCDPQNALYPAELLTNLPEDISNFSLGSGNPISPANLQPGETVLDLGSGGGLDCFLAAQKVSESGQVIGVDMTPEMLEKARAGAERLSLKNVEIREGYLENLPVDDNSVDVVISNCVINLSPDKPQVLREIFRVLKPGGRVSVSDIVTNRPLSAEKNQENWCNCISGALPFREYIDHLNQIGFTNIQLTPDYASVEKAIDSGQIQIRSAEIFSKASKDEIMQYVQNWENAEGNMYIPHLISAKKPA